jgi:uncharacterized protein (TIGR03435 family)
MNQAKFSRLLLSLLASLMSVSNGQQFEAVTVKHYDHHNDHNTPLGPLPIFDCHVGPSRLQYNCSGSVPKLIGEALDLQAYQYKETGPEYVVTGKLSKPVKRSEMDATLAEFLRESMGVHYHLEKRPMKAEFLTVVNKQLLKELPESHDAIPLAEAMPGQNGVHARWVEFVHKEPVLDEPGVDQERLECKNISFRLLAEMLYTYYRTPIVDDTGTSERFNLTMVARWDLAEPGPARNFDDVKKILSKYGIAVQTRTGLVDFLVIDKVGAESGFIN